MRHGEAGVMAATAEHRPAMLALCALPQDW